MAISAHPFAFGVAILAAGQSSRMGRSKPLLPWGPTTVLGRLLEIWHTLGASQLAVVCRGDDLIRGACARTCPEPELIINRQAELGMFSSIQTAARWPFWQQQLTHIVVALGDQPHLPSATLEKLLSFSASNPESVCQPSYQGRPKHPVVLPRAVLIEADTCEELVFSDFLAHRQRSLCEIPDPSLALDMDTPEDYTALLQRFARADVTIQ